MTYPYPKGEHMGAVGAQIYKYWELAELENELFLVGLFEIFHYY